MDQTALTSVIATMEQPVTAWMESVSVRQATQGTGVKTTAQKDIMERIATNLASVNLKTTFAIQHSAVFVNPDTEVTTVQLLSLAWLCTPSHPSRVMDIPESFLVGLLASSSC